MFLMLDKLIDLWGILKNVQFAGEKTPAKASKHELYIQPFQGC